MALLNPVYGLIVPFLFVVTIPLAIVAGITTTLAFSVLMFRVAVVYIDIAVNMVPQYITGRRMYPFPRIYTSSIMTTTAARSDMQPMTSPALASSGHSSPSRNSGRQHRRRRTSFGSHTSAGSMTSIEDAGQTSNTVTTNNNNNNPNTNHTLTAASKRNSFVMVPSVGFDRDFEGVGGWRLNGKDADDDDAWTQLNSRLELPFDRHHHRTPSGGGAVTPGGGGSGGDYLVMKSSSTSTSPRARHRSPENHRRGRERRQHQQGMVSPNSSRQRTPNGIPPMPLTTMDQAEGSGSYFPPASPRSSRRSG